MTRRLVIVDRYDAAALSVAAAAAARGDVVDVLLLGLSTDWLRWRHPERASLLHACRVLESAAFAEPAHSLVRQFLVDYIARLPSIDLGGQTLRQLLHEEEGNGWWYLETSEKGPYRGPLVGQLYALALVHLAVARGAYDDISYDLQDASLRGVLGSAGTRFTDVARSRAAVREGSPLLRYCANAALSAVRLIGAWLLSGSGEVHPGATLIFTAYPAWWAGAVGDHPRERFFGGIEASQIGGYLALVTAPGSLLRSRAAVRRTATARRIVFLQQFLSMRDLATLLSPRRFWRLVTFQRRWRAALRARFTEFEVGPLIARDVARSMSGGEPFQDVLLARATRRAVARFAPSTIVYRAEFQPSENALLRGSAGLATRIGFVHFPFGERYLPIAFTQGEVAGHLARQRDPDSRPFPEGFLASGDAIAAHVAAGGFPRDRVALCGPIRYGSLVGYRRSQPAKAVLRQRLGLASGATIIFVALAIVQADTEALFGALADALADGAGDRHVLVRTHPNRPAADPALQAAVAALGHGRASLLPAGVDVYDYIGASDVMVCIGSMIAFEAIALGVMPIVFDNPATYGAVSLAEYDEGLFVVRSGAELNTALHEALGRGPAAAAKRDAWPRVLARVFRDLDRSPAEQFAHAMEGFEAHRAATAC